MQLYPTLLNATGRVLLVTAVILLILTALAESIESVGANLGNFRVTLKKDKEIGFISQKPRFMFLYKYC